MRQTNNHSHLWTVLSTQRGLGKDMPLEWRVHQGNFLLRGASGNHCTMKKNMTWRLYPYFTVIIIIYFISLSTFVRFTRASCGLVFCPPWERCIEGHCSCKLPYQCPTENVTPVCGLDKRNYRSYCQVTQEESEPFGNMHKSINRLLNLNDTSICFPGDGCLLSDQETNDVPLWG